VPNTFLSDRDRQFHPTGQGKLKTEEQFKRILVVCTRQLGDVLMTTPLIRATKERWPDASVDMLGFSGTLGLLRGNSDIREFIEMPEGSGWVQSRWLIRRLWRRYELVLVAQHTDRAHLIGWVAAKVRSGQVIDEPRGWWKRRLLRHAVLMTGGHSHAVIEKMRLLEPWVQISKTDVIPPPAEPLQEELASSLAARYVVLHVPSLVRYKQWPVRHFERLTQLLIGQGLQVVLSGGPSASDRSQVAQVAQVSPPPRVLDMAGKLGFGQLTTLLKGALLYVGPDSSITHLAASLDIPVISLYGPIDPRQWGPWPPSQGPVVPYQSRDTRQQARKVIVLQGPQPCVPCNKAGCDNHVNSRSECLETMAPERVFAEAMTVLASLRSGAD